MRGTEVLFAIWGLALAIKFAPALAFPILDTSSFFSSMQGAVREQTDMLELYLPANVF